MSYTEIFVLKKSGEVVAFGETKNSWRGAMAIWSTLERKYLPSLPIPAYSHLLSRNGEKYDYHSRTMVTIGFSEDEDPLKEIWSLYRDDRLSEHEKTVLGTTFDNVIVRLENLPKVIEAFRKFEGETSLQEQADIIERALTDEDTSGVAWNQTSVNGDAWTSSREILDEDGDLYDYEPYNVNIDSEHWFLFSTPSPLEG